MSENSFPFGNAPQQPQTQEFAGESIARGRDRRALVAVAGAAAVALTAGGAFFVFSSGDDADSSVGIGASAPAASPTGTASRTAGPTSVPALYRNDIGRNPFKALVTPSKPADGGGSGGGSGAGGSGDGGGSTQPINGTGGALPLVPSSLPTSQSGSDLPVTGSPLVPPVAGPTTLPAAPTAKPSPHTVSVLAVDPANLSATIEVDAKEFADVQPGTVFATYFKLLRVEDGKCTSMSYGDERFDLCAGASTELR